LNISLNITLYILIDKYLDPAVLRGSVLLKSYVKVLPSLQVKKHGTFQSPFKWRDPENQWWLGSGLE